MTKRKLVVEVSSIEDSLARFKATWKKAERGDKINTPIQVLSFENAVDLIKTLSPKRLELLKELHKLEKVSIRQLAKLLHRDYSNVYQDIKALLHIGVILESDEGKYYVPWDCISTEISLCAKNKANRRKHQHHGGVLGDTAASH